MGDCTDCKYRENMYKWPCYDCEKGDKWEEFSYTNADRIRAMTDDELAMYFTDDMYCDSDCPAIREGCGFGDGCYKAWLYWLKQEVTE